MDLEDNTLREIKPDKDKYQLPYDLSHIWSPQIFLKNENTHTDTENRLVVASGRAWDVKTGS